MSWGSDLLRDAARGWGRWQAKYALGRSHLLLCDCQAVRGRAIELGVSQDRIVVFPWGVDLRRFRPGQRSAIRAQLGWGDSFVVLSARTLEPIYGVDILIEGFVRAAAEEPRLRLLLLSDGGMRDSLVRRIDRAGLQACVHFAGVIEEGDLPDYYHAADLYVSASRSDGSSVTLLEAMACGVPVLVSDIPGNREWVDPEGGGWLFRDGDPDALASGLQRALAGSRRLPEMGRKGRARVVAEADWSANRQMLLDAYQLVTSQGPRDAP
jgi:glycosyltransferase involved in cell wall biosynthesis